MLRCVFLFASNADKVKEILAKFPTNYKASAVMPLLVSDTYAHVNASMRPDAAQRSQSAACSLLALSSPPLPQTLAQEQNDNWLPLAAMNRIAAMLDMPPIRVYEVATFYSMYNREPMAKWHLQVCGTTPCQLCGSEKILSTLEKALGVAPGQPTADNQFVFTEVECLGACANAPMLQLNNHEFYENLDDSSVLALVAQLRKGGIAATTVGPQSGLQKVAEGPQGKTTLKSEIDPTKGVRDMDALIRQVKEEQEKAKAAAAAPKPAAPAAPEKK